VLDGTDVVMARTNMDEGRYPLSAVRSAKVAGPDVGLVGPF